MQFVRGFKARANRIAIDLRRDLGLRPASPMDPLNICEHFEIAVIPLSELRDADDADVGRHFLATETTAFSAITVCRGMRRAIVHNDRHSIVRQRSNLMHEIAHALLGHRATPLLAGDGERNFDQLIEAEAHFLGGCLLIPNEAARHIVMNGLQRTAAAAYGVSAKMLAYRLGVSGALRIAQRYSQGQMTAGSP
jgi:Zn-dependent peptidase ImmA (M78 family)